MPLYVRLPHFLRYVVCRHLKQQHKNSLYLGRYQ
ncbi:UNVERIFIED_CONTAM: hypothetical protein GTU68_032007 [Idotea baltica]|nr:hypothetical protein [Idotea baltica]